MTREELKTRMDLARDMAIFHEVEAKAHVGEDEIKVSHHWDMCFWWHDIHLSCKKTYLRMPANAT